MHILNLPAPALEGEGHAKHLDFTPASIAARWKAGRELACSRIAAAAWDEAVDPAMGIVVHG